MAGKPAVNALEEKRAKKRLREEIASACKTARDFFDRRKGVLLALTDDVTFTALLRGSLRSIGAGSPDSVFCGQDREAFFKRREQAVAENRLVFFIIEEAARDGESNNDVLRETAALKCQKIIFSATTSQSEPNHTLLRELGARGIIVKPTDANALTVSLASGMRDPSPEEMLVDKVVSLAVAGNGEEAARIAAVIARARPDYPPVYLAMGDAYAAKGDAGRAKLSWAVASSKDERYLEPMQRLSGLAKKEGNLEEELKWLMKMDKASPLNSARKARIAEACIDLDKADLAEEFLEQAWRRSDEGTRERLREVSKKLAMKVRDNDPAVTEKYLRKNLDEKKGALGMEDVRAFNFLGLALRRQGKAADAILEYRRALRIAPDSPELLYNLAMAMAENFDKPGAAKVMEKALAFSDVLFRSGKGVVRNMAMIFMAASDYPNAAACLEALLEIDPGDRKIADLCERVKKALNRGNTN